MEGEIATRRSFAARAECGEDGTVASGDSEWAGTQLRRLRYPGTCAGCGARLAGGVEAYYLRQSGQVRCVGCGAEGGSSVSGLDVVDGQAGGSAAAVYQRRHEQRRDRVLASHPRLGRALLAVFDDPQSTRAWAGGAEGEQIVGESLRRIAGDQVRVLNDRRMPGSRANIDHLAITASGVYVIDAKRYVNQRVASRGEGGLFTPRRELLIVGGRDRSVLVDGVLRQAAVVRDALSDVPDVVVRGVLCFVEAEWPLLGNACVVRGVTACSPRKLRELLTRPGSLTAGQICELQQRLHEQFRRAA